MSALRHGALLAALALAGCQRAPAGETLHARLALDLRQDVNAGVGGMAGGVHTIRQDAIALVLAVPVRVAAAGQTWTLDTDATRQPSLAGRAALHEERGWYNWEAASSSLVDLHGQWPEGAPAAVASVEPRAGPPRPAASGAVAGPALRIDVAALDPAGPHGDLRASVVVELPLSGKASGSVSQFGGRRPYLPDSPWPGCALSATGGSCRIVLDASSRPAAAPAAASAASTAAPDDMTEPPPPDCSRDIPRLRVTWDRDGRFVARADRLPDARSPCELHLVLWTTASEPTIAP